MAIQNQAFFILYLFFPADRTRFNILVTQLLPDSHRKSTGYGINTTQFGYTYKPGVRDPV